MRQRYGTQPWAQKKGQKGTSKSRRHPAASDSEQPMLPQAKALALQAKVNTANSHHLRFLLQRCNTAWAKDFSSNNICILYDCLLRKVTSGQQLRATAPMSHHVQRMRLLNRPEILPSHKFQSQDCWKQMRISAYGQLAVSQTSCWGEIWSTLTALLWFFHLLCLHPTLPIPMLSTVFPLLPPNPASLSTGFHCISLLNPQLVLTNLFIPFTASRKDIWTGNFPKSGSDLTLHRSHLHTIQSRVMALHKAPKQCSQPDRFPCTIALRSFPVSRLLQARLKAVPPHISCAHWFHCLPPGVQHFWLQGLSKSEGLLLTLSHKLNSTLRIQWLHSSH